MKRKVIIRVKIYTGYEVIEEGYIRYNNVIEEVGSMRNYKASDDEIVYDAAGGIIIPGMIDIHIHGGYGIDVMDGEAELLLAFEEKLLQEGVTSFFPTTMTQSEQAITNALQSMREAKERGAHFPYIHLEGPYVSKKRAGAQPMEHIVPVNIEQFKKWQKESNDLIKLVTYAPEETDAEEFGGYLQEKGIVRAVGHSDATFAQLQELNICHATHLFNQMKPMHHREPGVVGYVLLQEDTMVEIIPDGIHVHPEMIKLAYRLKGAKKISVITDAMRAKGLKDGAYELGGQTVFVKEGKATLADGTLAGSVLKMDEAFRNIIAFTGCTIEEAVLMTSVNQAEKFQLHRKGALLPGKDADFVVLNEELFIEDTVRCGIHLNYSNGRTCDEDTYRKFK
ncbi:N-acetylglucosamine-6-phosphate deacetylase [Ectobacillus antri]|jgi:N-acetylglucosamine-6-phosphate deacetylase|uniref:N-acetylglucosamine-6-phosphate deacetylase n=1 Tax=Ectobacillus antri TaxID=2486280 RepID=A0ABT6H0V1_9BACI|nr:N-acetylglucosamine-6-phosphate deacetylase [Ectobacillus antri]MDG4655713.1 N-acetylglucosamine-6-phosphate deacetylase [Ectobacillus antri]MDG5752388.1 N-acetylglucosamine-6-phosphate deacetylase [Ectobacillus antri]